jgi:tetratricopeptide (TPR) repeat protein
VSSSPDLHTYLRSLDVRTLAGLLVEQAGRDPRLRRELEHRASAHHGTVAEAHRILDDAEPVLAPHEEGPDYATKISPVLDTLQRMLDAGTQADVTPLARRTVDRIGEAAGDLGDPTGAIGGELHRAVGLYARACAAHPPDPRRLADWILQTQFDLPGWPQIDLADFAAALGDPGIGHLKSVVDKILTENGDRPSVSRQETAQRLREQLAEVSGDVDTLVKILSAKPQRLEVNLRIVRALRGAGRHAEAIAFAAKALVHDKGTARAPVVDELAETYQETGQDDEALSVRRNEFRRNPTQAAYFALREGAAELGRWDAERERALETLREHAARDQEHADELVRVLLAEDRPEEAWQASERFEPSLALRLELAASREAEHPVDVIPVYRRHVEELITQKDATHYRQAAKQLRKLRSLHRRADTAEEFSTYLAELVETHKRKTRLIAEVRNARIALPKPTPVNPPGEPTRDAH